MKFFKAGTEHKFLETPKPARSFVPEWYKSIPLWRTGKKEIVEEDLTSSKGVKSCVPFLDSMTYGYMVHLQQDIEVVANAKGQDHIVKWLNDEIPPIEVRLQDGLENIPSPEGFSSYQYVWRNHFHMQTPKGYSLLVTHPLNRVDLPFYTLSGIIDADEGISAGRFPFYLQMNWSGIIPKGTPLLQLIPIKRDNWTIVRDDNKVVNLGQRIEYESNSVISGFYKNKLWKKKTFK